jgi:hypothetical protein
MIHKVIANAASDPFAIALSIVFVDLSSGCPVQGHLNLLYCRGVGFRYVPPFPTSIAYSSIVLRRGLPLKRRATGSLDGTAGHETVRRVDRSSATPDPSGPAAEIPA